MLEHVSLHALMSPAASIGLIPCWSRSLHTPAYVSLHTCGVTNAAARELAERPPQVCKRDLYARVDRDL